MDRVHIGTSGWSYKTWEETFYPANIPKSCHFDYYATRFSTVEINLTFYRLPTPNTVRGWREKAPHGFVYAVKGSRFITHMKKLANLDGAVRRFFERIEPLKSHLGVILWQLPPRLRLDLPRLEDFLAQLPRCYPYAVEFRHRSWLEPEVFEILRRHRVAQVSVSSLAMPMDLTVTSDLVYLRFHGLTGGAAHDYTRAELKLWANHIRRQAHHGRQVFAYFNNDANVRAPANAQLLREMVGDRRSEVMTAAEEERVAERDG